ncbi:unnamed protein product [Closterium sp. NIES-54]
MTLANLCYHAYACFCGGGENFRGGEGYMVDTGVPCCCCRRLHVVEVRTGVFVGEVLFGESESSSSFLTLILPCPCPFPTPASPPPVRKRRNERREREYAQQREAATNDALTLQGAGAAGAWLEEFPPLLPAAARDPSSRRNQQLEEILEAVEEIRVAQREERGVGRGEGQEEEEEEGLDLDPEHELPAEQVCVVCAGRVRRAVFIPCGHRVCCLRCARAVKESSSLCPICRRFVRRVYQVFDT